MSIEVSGKVVKVGEIQQITDSFKKRELWIDTDSKYRNQLSIEFKQDGCVHLDDVSVGDEVNCSINIEGNEYNGKRYTSISGWKIQNLSAGSSASDPNNPPENLPPAGEFEEYEEDSSIPF